MSSLSRRRLLQGSAAALACTGFARDATGAGTPRIEAPVVDSLSIQVVTGGNHGILISGAQERPVLRSEWSLSLWPTSARGTEEKRILRDAEQESRTARPRSRDARRALHHGQPVQFRGLRAPLLPS